MLEKIINAVILHGMGTFDFGKIFCALSVTDATDGKKTEYRAEHLTILSNIYSVKLTS